MDTPDATWFKVSKQDVDAESVKKEQVFDNDVVINGKLIVKNQDTTIDVIRVINDLKQENKALRETVAHLQDRMETIYKVHANTIDTLEKDLSNLKTKLRPKPIQAPQGYNPFTAPSPFGPPALQ